MSIKLLENNGLGEDERRGIINNFPKNEGFNHEFVGTFDSHNGHKVLTKL